MSSGFGSIPDVVIDYVRAMFAKANGKVFRAMVDQPSLHEQMLDHLLLANLARHRQRFSAGSKSRSISRRIGSVAVGCSSEPAECII